LAADIVIKVGCSPSNTVPTRSASTVDGNSSCQTHTCPCNPVHEPLL